MKIYYSNDFTGHYPVGTSAIVGAETEEQARRMLGEELQKQGLEFNGTLTEFSGPGVIVLQNGDY